EQDHAGGDDARALLGRRLPDDLVRHVLSLIGLASSDTIPTRPPRCGSRVGGAERGVSGAQPRGTPDRPAPARSMSTVSPSRPRPPSNALASWSPIADWTSRRNGRAP